MNKTKIEAYGLRNGDIIDYPYIDEVTNKRPMKSLKILSDPIETTGSFKDIFIIFKTDYIDGETLFRIDQIVKRYNK
jgi:hypothetical protein